MQPILGAHTSIAGGYYKAIERAHEVGCAAFQIFTKNNNQWRAKAITDEEVQLFRNALIARQLDHPTAHTSYLINLASCDKGLWKKSIDSMVVELQRAEMLGIRNVVVHPGSHVGGTEAAGLAQCVRAVNAVHSEVAGADCVLEVTAGQGTSLGWRFEHLARILDKVKEPDRVGVCLDTCHVFAAGYPLATKRDYDATFAEFDSLVGIHRLRVIHLNDSKRPLGSRVDRHEHIGKGQIGLDVFKRLLNDRRLRHVPMLLETPKGDHEGEDWDVINLRTLRALVRGGRQKRIAPPAPTK